jgi:hypothetical protein
MGAQIFSIPFRLTAAGTVATVEQGSDRANAEQIGVLCTTIIGERDLVPGFGLTDPAFRGIRAGELAAKVARWGPPVKVTSVSSHVVSATETDVTVGFS